MHSSVFFLNQVRPKLHSKFYERNEEMWESPNLGKRPIATSRYRSLVRFKWQPVLSKTLQTFCPNDCKRIVTWKLLFVYTFSANIDVRHMIKVAGLLNLRQYCLYMITWSTNADDKYPLAICEGQRLDQILSGKRENKIVTFGESTRASWGSNIGFILRYLIKSCDLMQGLFNLERRVPDSPPTHHSGMFFRV